MSDAAINKALGDVIKEVGDLFLSDQQKIQKLSKALADAEHESAGLRAKLVKFRLLLVDAKRYIHDSQAFSTVDIRNEIDAALKEAVT